MKRKFFILLIACAALGAAQCARKPAGLKHHEPEELYQAVTSFYDFLRTRDLDSFADKADIQVRFEDQSRYYAFLDTMLPAMWERKFEHNRILAYQITAIKINEDQTEAWVKIWIRSDDTLPFGKVMTFSHRWYTRKFNWYPAEIKAPKATILEKYR
jgi:hypothetical protein